MILLVCIYVQKQYRFFFQDRKVVEHLHGCLDPRNDLSAQLVLVLVNEHLGVLAELS